jgi:tol-pal system protein YbgF
MAIGIRRLRPFFVNTQNSGHRGESEEMRKYIFVAAAYLLCIAGCATTADVNDVRRDLRYLQQKLDVPGENVRLLKDENAGMRSDLMKNEEALSAVRTRQAELGADITSLRADIQHLTGQIDAFRKESDAANTGNMRRDEEIKALKEKLDAVSFKTDHIGMKADPSGAEQEGTHLVPKETFTGKTEEKAAYAAAYDEFKAGRYAKARTGFQDFLRQHPDTKYSDNAQFWIGECFYFEKNYEKAILEYEKVVKKYPDGDRVPFAMLKQGQSFINLGDKTGARFVLQQVIRDYPNTNQAKIAREKLLEIR